MKRITKLATAIVLLLALIMSLTGCLWIGGRRDSEYMTKEEVEALIAGKLDSDVTIDNVNNYDINIENNGNGNLTSAAKAVLSSVRVIANHKRYYSYTGGTKSYSAEGAGTIYRLDKTTGSAYIITNFHVVYDSSSNTSNHVSSDINLRLYGMEDEKYNIPATYVGGSMTLDLAVLKVERSSILANSCAMAVTMADSDDVSILDTAIAVGNPASGGLSATVGCINVDGEYITMTAADGTTAISLRLFRIDTAVNSGNSGGGLYNDRGELIGVVNAKLSSSTIDSIGYAIPSNVAKFAADNIIKYCNGTSLENPYKYFIGISMDRAEYYTEYDKDTGKVHKLEKVKISSVTQGSVSDGLFVVGDVIKKITIDGKEYEIDRMYQVIDCMYSVYENSTLVITVEHADGTTADITVPLETLTPEKVK